MSFSEIGAILNVLIILGFAYMVMSLAASMAVEWIGAWFKWRGKMLKKRLGEMFDDVEEQGFMKLLLTSPLLRSYAGRNSNSWLGRLYGSFSGTAPGGVGLPSYLAPDGFARAVVASLQDNNLMRPADMPPVLRVILQTSGLKLELPDDLVQFRSEIAAWYDQAMDRLSGTYKRRSQLWLFMIGLVLAIGFNINFLHISKSLWDFRYSLEQSVQDIESLHAFVDENKPEGQTVEAFLAANKDARTRMLRILEDDVLASATLPIGWTLIDEDCPEPAGDGVAQTVQENGIICTPWQGLGAVLTMLVTPADWNLLTVLGWLISALLIIPGASFWFDSLGFLISIRSAGVKPKIT